MRGKESISLSGILWVEGSQDIHWEVSIQTTAAMVFILTVPHLTEEAQPWEWMWWIWTEWVVRRGKAPRMGSGPTFKLPGEGQGKKEQQRQPERWEEQQPLRRGISKFAEKGMVSSTQRNPSYKQAFLDQWETKVDSWGLIHRKTQSNP